jgi:hypothetical protein
MKQTVFNFANDNVLEQLELFPTSIYDNRVQRLRYSLKLIDWLSFTLNDVREIGKLFKVSHQIVYEEYNRSS